MQKKTASLTLGFAMVEMTVKYLGDLRCEATHGPSGKTLVTDAPVDNEGKGESFSPTDLAATSLGACMMTILGIVSRRHEIDITGTTLTVRKIMSTEAPRKIGRIEVAFRIPLPPNHPKRELLESSSRACPVHFSLHPAIEQDFVFDWTGLPAS